MNTREILLGPGYYYHKRLLEDSKTWTEVEIKAFQHRQLDRLGVTGIESKEIIDKSYYRTHLDEFENKKLRFLSKRVTTGGTSAEPFTFYLDRFSARQKERAYIYDIWREINYKPFDLRVIFRGNFTDQAIIYKWTENAYIISPNQLTTSNSQNVAHALMRLPPFFLHVYPSSLFTFIDLLGPNIVSRLPIRGVMAGSEAFPPGQMKKAQETLDCPICHWYGHSEYAVLGKYCSKCDGFHFYPTYGLAEFELTDHGYHEIIATSFRRLGTRFIRYRTEDLALITDTVCSASQFTRVDSILGRSQEFFIDSDGTKRAFGPFLFGIHGEFWEWVQDIQFIQQNPGLLVCRVVLKYQKRKSHMEDFLRNRFGLVKIEFEYVESISKTPRGKHRFFVSDLS